MAQSPLPTQPLEWMVERASLGSNHRTPPCPDAYPKQVRDPHHFGSKKREQRWFIIFPDLAAFTAFIATQGRCIIAITEWDGPLITIFDEGYIDG